MGCLAGSVGWVCLQFRSWYWGPGIELQLGLSAHRGVCFSLFPTSPHSYMHSLSPPNKWKLKKTTTLMSSRVKNTKIKLFSLAFKLDNMASTYLPSSTSYQFHHLEVYTLCSTTPQHSWNLPTTFSFWPLLLISHLPELLILFSHLAGPAFKTKPKCQKLLIFLKHVSIKNGPNESLPPSESVFLTRLWASRKIEEHPFTTKQGF